MALTSSEGGRLARGRLLVITYHFTPDRSVGGLRWAGLSKYLARMGWEVHVLTAAAQPTEVREPGLYIHVRGRSRTLDDAYKAIAHRVRRSGPSNGVQAVAPSTLHAGGVVTGLRVEAAEALSFPDYARGWILRCALDARRLLARLHFDAVVSSGPPHSAHLAGMIASLGRPGRHWIDMRDPWSDLMDSDWGRALYKSALGRFATPRLERLVMRRAAGVITNTLQFRDSMRVRYPERSIHCVSNGIDPERLPQPNRRPSDILSIAHVGTLYAGRDMSPILEGLRAFVDRRPDTRSRLRLHLAGGMDGEHALRFHQQLAASGLADIVHIHGVIPGPAALELLNQSHLALVLAQNQKMQIPAKLYECVGMRIPTLVIAEETSAASREALRIGASALDGHDRERICSFIEQIWVARDKPREAPAATISYDGLAVQMDQLLTARPAAAR